MNQSELLQFLEEKNIRFELTSHPAAFSMNEERDYTLPHPEADAKNLFVRDDKREIIIYLPCEETNELT